MSWLWDAITGKHARDLELFEEEMANQEEAMGLDELPVGATAFHKWSEWIIALTGLPASVESQKFVLADMLVRLPDGVAHKEPRYFIDGLRKYAINQVAEAMKTELREATKARLKAQEEAEKAPQKEAIVKPRLGVVNEEGSVSP